MGLLEIVALVRMIAKAVQHMSDLPNVNDPEQVYAWLVEAADILKPIVEKTPATLDDKALAWMEVNVISSYEQFNEYYNTVALVLRIISMIRGGATDQEIVEVETEKVVACMAPGKVGDAITIVMLVVQLVRMILDLRRG